MSKWGLAPPTQGAAAAAAAAALNAKLQSKGVAWLKQEAQAQVKLNKFNLNGRAPAAAAPSLYAKKPDDVLIEINDAPNRAELTKKPFHQMIMSEYKVAVTMRGRWYRPGEKKPAMTDANKPLHLFVEAGEGADHENFAKAVEKIKETLAQTGSSSATSGGARARSRNNSGGSGKMVEKLWLRLTATPEFDIPAKMCGNNDAFLEYIESASQATSVSLRGRGASAGPPSIRRQDSMEMLHVHIVHTTRDGMNKACELSQKLIEQVQADYHTTLGPRAGPPHGYGGAPPQQQHGYHQHQQQHHSHYPHPHQYPPSQQQYYPPQHQMPPSPGYGYHPPQPHSNHHHQYNNQPRGYQYPPSYPSAGAGAGPPPLPGAGSAAGAAPAAAGPPPIPPQLPPPGLVASPSSDAPPELPPHAAATATAAAPAAAPAPAPAPAAVAVTAGRPPVPPSAEGSTARVNYPPQLPPPPVRRSFQEKVSLAPPPRPPAGADVLEGGTTHLPRTAFVKTTSAHSAFGEDDDDGAVRKRPLPNFKLAAGGGTATTQIESEGQGGALVRPASATEDPPQGSAAKKPKVSLVDYDDEDE